MRVLHVLPTRAVEYGGPVAVASETVEELCRQGVEATIFPFCDDASSEAKKRVAFGRNAWGALQNAVSGVDLVHIHGLWNIPATVAAHTARGVNIPYVIAPHGMLDKWALQQSRLKKKVYSLLCEQKNLKAAAGLHFLNTEELSEAKESGLSAPCFILPNGIHPEKYAELPHRNAFETRYPHCREKVLVLFLGRLHPKKGFDVLLPAFAQAAKIVPNLHLIIAGPDEGKYRKIINDMVKQYNLSLYVTFVGMVRGNEKFELFGAADFFVLTSHQEGDSISVKEAMASGLPVVISHACHFPEVAELKAGFVVQSDTAELQRALEIVGSRQDMRKAMGATAKQMIYDRYGWPGIVKRLRFIYEDITKLKITSSDWKK